MSHQQQLQAMGAGDQHDDLDASLAMAQAALGVKNAAIDMLIQEVSSLRRENDDLFLKQWQAVVVQQQQQQPPTGTMASIASLSVDAVADSNSQAGAAAPPVAAPPPQQQHSTSTNQQHTAADQTQLRQQHQPDEVLVLRAELSAARQHISALEAELQDTMDAAMQLWETVQGGSYSEGTPSRAGSLYQDQLLSPSMYAADVDDDLNPAAAAAAAADWRTPSASPAPFESPLASAAAPSAGSLATPGGDPAASAAVACRLADLAAAHGVLLNADGGAAAATSSSPRLMAMLLNNNKSGSRSGSSSIASGQVPVAQGVGSGGGNGIFTPIEARVTSLTNKLRGYMLRQPDAGLVPLSPAGAAAAASGCGDSPLRPPPPGLTGSVKATAAGGVDANSPAAASRLADADVQTTRDVDGRVV